MSEQTTTKSHFDVLNAINVNDHVEKKDNKMSYLTWAWAWAEVKKLYPNASYQIHKTPTGLPYVEDPNTGYMVFTTVTIDGVSHDMWMAVMDGAFMAMKKDRYTYEGWTWKNGVKVRIEKSVDACSMHDINRAIMRCLVKNLAMFGLGLYIYAGEDLPEMPIEPTPVAPPATSPIAEKAPTKKATAKKDKPEQVAPSATQPNPPAGDYPSPPVLELDTENWSRVSAYISEPSNKAKGLEKVLQQVSRKYTISDAAKAEIEKIISA